MEVTESLKNSLEALNDLSAGHLAHKILPMGCHQWAGVWTFT